MGEGHCATDFQRHQTGAPGQGETFESRAGENAIFSRQRNQVRNRAQRHQIQMPAQIIFDSGRVSVFAQLLDHGMGQLKRQPRRTELRAGRSGQARIDQRHGRGRRRGNLVVIEHDDLGSFLAEPGDGVGGRRAAIHGQQQRGGIFFQAILRRVPAQPVAFVHAMRQIIMDVPAERAERFQEQGGGGDAIHVVIAKDHQRFAAPAGAQETLHRRRHVREQQRVRQIPQARLQKAGGLVRLDHAAVDQALGEQGRDPQGGGERGGQAGGRRIGQ